MFEISCGTEFNHQYFQRHLYGTEYEKKFVVLNIQKNDAKPLYEKLLQKMGTIQESDKDQQEKKHKSVTSHELLGTTLCIFMVSKIWQEMNT